MKRKDNVFECCRIPRSFLGQRLRALDGFEARPNIDFERLVAAAHARALISGGMCGKLKPGRRFRVPSNIQKFPRKLISSAQWFPGPSNDFEFPLAAEHPSNNVERKAKPVQGRFSNAAQQFLNIQVSDWNG